MIVKGDDGPTMEAPELFSLKLLKSKDDFAKIIDQDPNDVAESDEEDKDDSFKRKLKRYSKDEEHLDSSGVYYKDSESEIEMESDEETDKITEGLGK